MNIQYLSTSVGRLVLGADDSGICWLRPGDAPSGAQLVQTPLLQTASIQLEEYFAGRRKDFELPLSLSGTPFQRACWDALCAIPYGETRTYAQQAAAVGNPKACRAVGMANHVNPIIILVPCHRVIGSNGRLTGYACGLLLKQFLLDLEASHRTK